MFRRFVIPLALIGVLLLSAVITRPWSVSLAAQTDVRYFPETQHTVRGLFLQYWTEHGGLAQQGYPLTEEFPEQSALDGKTYQVQYFERAVFERHPENAGTPYEVLLAQLGTYELKTHYPGGTPASVPNAANARAFAETGHSVGGIFRTYWEGHGGLAQQGYPLTDELTEVSALDGKTYTVQYFERAVFEAHPENVGTPYDVLLAQLGKYQLDRSYPNNSNPAAAPVPPSGGPTPAATQLPAATQPPATPPPATPPPAPATATIPPPPPSGQCAAGAGITAQAWVSDPMPSGGSLTVSGAICNNGQGLANIPMHTDWHYRTTTPSCDGVSGSDGVASCSRSIGNAASGFTVVIDVAFTVNGQLYRTTTSFTPR